MTQTGSSFTVLTGGHLNRGFRDSFRVARHSIFISRGSLGLVRLVEIDDVVNVAAVGLTQEGRLRQTF